MSVCIVSHKQFGDLALMCRRSVNNKDRVSKDKFMEEDFDCICKHRHSTSLDAMDKRYGELEDWLQDCVRWNLRSYRMRYKHSDGAEWTESVVKREVEVYCGADGEPVSREQAIFSLQSLLYQSDYDSYVDDDDELLPAYRAWREVTERLEYQLMTRLFDGICREQGCQWMY